jgi:hypothetical protein
MASIGLLRAPRVSTWSLGLVVACDYKVRYKVLSCLKKYSNYTGLEPGAQNSKMTFDLGMSDTILRYYVRQYKLE